MAALDTLRPTCTVPHDRAARDRKPGTTPPTAPGTDDVKSHRTRCTTSIHLGDASPGTPHRRGPHPESERGRKDRDPADHRVDRRPGTSPSTVDHPDHPPLRPHRSTGRRARRRTRGEGSHPHAVDDERIGRERVSPSPRSEMLCQAQLGRTSAIERRSSSWMPVCTSPPTRSLATS